MSGGAIVLLVWIISQDYWPFW